MRTLAGRKPLLTFYVLAVAIAAAVILWSILLYIANPASAGALGQLVDRIMAGDGYINILTIAGALDIHASLAGIFVFAAAPTIAALIVAALGGGGGLRRLLARLRPLGPDGQGRSRAIAVYLGILIVYALGFLVYDFVAGPGVDPFGRLRWLGGGAIVGALVGLFIDEGGTLEELGWRGFAWPLLQDMLRNPLLAALAVGVLHWAWHLPREATGLLGGLPAGWLFNQTIFLLLCIALAVVCGYAVNLAGGSVWPAVFIHGGSNVWSKAVGEYALPTFGVDLRTILLVAIALVILACAGRRLGRAAP